MSTPDPSTPESSAQDPSARSRRDVAVKYRAQRTRELNERAEAAVGAPVAAAGSFSAYGTWGAATKMLKLMIPVVGWYLLARDRRAARGVADVQILAVDDERLYAIGPGAGQATWSPAEKPEILESWSLAEIELLGLERQGTDHVISLRDRTGGRELRFFCSSLQTNPWASEVVRRLGGAVPEPIGEPDTLEPYDEPPRESDL